MTSILLIFRTLQLMTNRKSFNAQPNINVLNIKLYTYTYNTHTYSMDPMLSGRERRLVVTDRRQCLCSGYRRLLLYRWIEVIEVQAAAQTDFVTDYLIHVALDRREFVQVYV